MTKKKDKEKDNKDAVHQPHDTAFKNTFSNKEAMLDFLAANLPSDLFSKIDQENLELTNKSFVDPVGRRGESDLVFKTNINRQKGYIYVLTEHQSTEDSYMPLRFMEYVRPASRGFCDGSIPSSLDIRDNACITLQSVATSGVQA